MNQSPINKKKILIIGASTDASRYSFIAAHKLCKAGYEIINLGAKPGVVAGTEFTHQFPTGQDIDTITLYINPRLQESYLEDMIKAKPRRIIFNPGTENPAIYPLLEKNQIICEEACTLVLLSLGKF